VFAYRDSREGDVSRIRVDVAFTDSSLDLQGLTDDFPHVLGRLEDEIGVPLARASQVHGDTVLVVDAPIPLGHAPTADALVTTRRGLGLMVRVADCVPVVLADAEAGVVGAVHSGRHGMVLDIATRAVDVMRRQGASEIVAWMGPHVCGSCYEVPDEMRDEVGAVVPEACATTSWGTSSLDLGAGVRAQLERAGVEVLEVGDCTLETQTLHSYRRDGSAAGRFAGLVWLR
jgi:YfiH family protein